MATRRSGAQIEDNLIEFLLEVEHVVVLLELETKPPPTANFSQADELSQKLPTTVPGASEFENN